MTDAISTVVRFAMHAGDRSLLKVAAAVRPTWIPGAHHTRCKACGLRKRGPGHEDGESHKRRSAAKAGKQAA